MSFVIVYTRAEDGGTSIICPVPGVTEEVARRALPPDAQNISVRPIEDIPSDRTFRNAWTHELLVDMPKAREIHMNRIRAVRDAKIEELDIETLKGKDVQAQKQVLRDIPQKFDLSKANTPNELKVLWPVELPRP